MKTWRDSIVRAAIRQHDVNRSRRKPGRDPRWHSPCEFPDEILVPHLRGLPDDLVRVLVHIPQDNERGVLGGHPAQPGRERVSQLDAQRPWHVGSPKLFERPHIDKDGIVVAEQT